MTWNVEQYGLGDFRALLGEIQSSSPCVAQSGLNTGEGAQSRFPCGPNAGELAQRYSSYDAVPVLLRLTAVQCGQCWYARPSNPLTAIEDEGSQLYDAATGAVASGINYVSDEVLSVGRNTLVLAGIALGAYLILPALLRGKR